MKIIEGSGVRRSVWLLSLAIMLVGAAVFVVMRPALTKPPAPPRATKPAAKAPAHDAGAATSMHPQDKKQLRERVPPAVPPAHPPENVAAPPQPQVAAAPPAAADSEAAAQPAGDETTGAAEANDANQPTGIAVFPPPGTKPIKRGIVVPDGVDLPPGYVRHYQTTDDGQQLPPILMFHPDYHPVDAHGNPIPLPEDRIVPPDMAPPGMPVEMLNVPAEGAPVTGAPAQGRKRQDSNGGPSGAQTIR